MVAACRADPGPVEISIDISQKGVAEFYRRCEIYRVREQNSKGATRKTRVRDPNGKNATVSPFMSPDAATHTAMRVLVHHTVIYPDPDPDSGEGEGGDGYCVHVPHCLLKM